MMMKWDGTKGMKKKVILIAIGKIENWVGAENLASQRALMAQTKDL